MTTPIEQPDLATESPAVITATAIPPVQVLDAEVVEPVFEPRKPAWIVRLVLAIGSGLEWVFGLLTLVLGLAVLATIPIVQLLSLGYLLEVCGRVARTGRKREAFIGIRKAARAGSLILGTWLVIWPVRLVSDMWYSASLIDPEGQIATRWRVALLVLSVVTVAHVVWAWVRGGRFRHFLWPAPLRFWRWLRTPGKFATARDGSWEYFASLRLGYYFRLGLVGFLTAFAWLALPIVFFIGATALTGPAAVGSGIMGSVMLAGVVMHLPFLQARFGASRNWRDMFDVVSVYRIFFGAPIACLIALVVTLAAALPLYLLKVELTPQQVTILPSIVFVLFIYPSRMLSGWATGRGERKPDPRRPRLRVFVCIGSFFLAAPAVGFYVFVVFFTRYTSWHGVWSLFEQHAFLLPVPFV